MMGLLFVIDLVALLMVLYWSIKYDDKKSKVDGWFAYKE